MQQNNLTKEDRLKLFISKNPDFFKKSTKNYRRKTNYLTEEYRKKHREEERRRYHKLFPNAKNKIVQNKLTSQERLLKKRQHNKNWYEGVKSTQWWKQKKREDNIRRRINAKFSNFTYDDWIELKKQYNYRCLCCGKTEPEIKLTIDHIVPIIKNGLHIKDNIQPLCGRCNCIKFTKTIDFRKVSC